MSKLYLTIVSLAFALFLSVPAVHADTATGTFESVIYDAGYDVTWGAIVWTASTTASSTISIKVRTSSASDMATASLWENCTALSNGADVSANACVSDGHRYIQYYAYLSSEYSGTSTFVTPELQNIEIKYGAVAILTSSTFHAGASDARLTEIRWTETLPGGTNIATQLRSSSDAISWTGWFGPDGTTSDYFTDNEGGDSMPAVFTNGSGERYFQYRAILSSDGAVFPVLSDLTIEFTASIPIATSISPPFASSNASGTLAMIISGEDFISGATLTVSSRELNFEITEKNISSDAISFNLDTSLFYGGPVQFTIVNPDGASVVNSDFYINEYRGSYESEIKDLHPNLYNSIINWTDITSSTGTVSVKVRSDDSVDMSGATDWDNCPVSIKGAHISDNLCVNYGERYLQYRLELIAVYGTSSVEYISPEFTGISFISTLYVATGTLISSPYNTGSAVNAIRVLTWADSKPANTDITFQIRTATDIAGSPGAWSDWSGPFTGSFYRDAQGKNGINIQHNDGVGDQWFQYQALLSSDGRDTPVLSDVSLEYGDKLFSAQIIEDNMIFGDGVIFR